MYDFFFTSQNFKNKITELYYKIMLNVRLDILFTVHCKGTNEQSFAIKIAITITKSQFFYSVGLIIVYLCDTEAL